MYLYVQHNNVRMYIYQLEYEYANEFFMDLTHFYIQLVNRPHFRTGILLFGQSGQLGKKSGFEEF